MTITRMLNPIRNLRRMTRSLLLALAVVVGLLAPATANAQFRMSFMNLDTPDFTSEELNRYATMLSLDESQKEAASAMLEAYLAEFTVIRNEWTKIRDGARDEFRDSRDPGIWQELQTVVSEVQKKKETLETTFLEDYRLLLTAEQDLRWEDLERTRRRERTLPNGGLVSGETVDLVRTIEDAKLTDEARQAIAPLVDTYARELDRVLIERNKVYESGMSRGMELWQNGDFDTMNDLLTEGTKQANRVREVHVRFVRQIEAALPETDRGVVEGAYNRQAYPQIYRDSAAVSALDAALKFDDLTEEQREQVNAVKERHDREAATLNDRWKTVVDRSEASRSVMDFMGGGNRDPEIRTARQARRDFDNRILTELRALLTEEQQNRLPAVETRPDWRRGPGGEGDDDGRGNRGMPGGRGGRGGPGGPGGGPGGPRGPQSPDA